MHARARKASAQTRSEWKTLSWQADQNQRIVHLRLTNCVLCCRVAKLILHILFTHSEHLIRFNWISLNHIFPLHNVLWTTTERVWSSIYLLYLSYRGGRKNLCMIIRILLDLGSLIICKLWLQLSRVLYGFPFPYCSRPCCVQTLDPRGTHKQDLSSICSVSI